HAFTLDFDRRHLVLDVTLAEEKLEFVFWCRGTTLSLDASLDGAPLAAGIRLGAEDDSRSLPLAIARADVPKLAGAKLAAPQPLQALVWLEPGVGDVAPVQSSPEELEMLRQLGYAH